MPALQPVDTHAAEAHAAPATVCDVLLDAAMTADADTIWFEPRLPAEDTYDVSIERIGRTVAAVSLPGAIGAAVVARLAMLAELDLVARRARTGSCIVRSPAMTAEIVVTTRPGRTLRAEVAVRRQRPRVVAEASVEPLGPGTVIGQYRLCERLGSGGMGEVFRVSHTVLGRSYALKVLRRDIGNQDAEAAGRFLREARAAARIKHRHIVDVFDFGYLDDGRPYLVMEMLEGESLSARLADGPIEPRVALAMARQLASALAAAHEVGVVHADVSPSNVLLVGDDVKLVDFGLAQLRNDPTRAASEQPAEYVFGTPSYIAPEMIRGLPAEERSDQYSLGAVMFEMLTGRTPYRASNLRELCVMHLRAPIPSLDGDWTPPAEVDRLIARCLAKQAKDRFPSMRALEAALVDAEQALFVHGGWRKWLSP